MDIFKKFLVVFMHIVSLWACSCLVRFLVGISQSSYKIPIQYIMPMVIFYGGLTLITVFYWVARFHQKKKLSDNTASINLERKENIESNAESTENKTENNINFDRVKAVINNISSALLKCFKGVNKDMILNIVKAGLIPVCALLVLGGVGFGIYKGIEANSLPACDSEFAENEVIEIFKQNNDEYLELNKWDMVSDIRISMVEPISYDKEVKKYECSARLTLLPSNSMVKGIPSKILPIISLTEFDYAKKQYKRIGTKAMAFWGNVTCDVNYTIYKEHGENQVTSSYCGGGLRYDEPLYLPEVILE